MLHDKDIYKIKCNIRKSILLKKVSEVNQLNALQYLNSSVNIYFGNNIDNAYMNYLHDNYFDKYNIEKISVKEYRDIKSDVNSKITNSLIAYVINSFKIGLSLSFLEFTENSKNIKLGPSLEIHRIPEFDKSYLEDIYRIMSKKENGES